jgi:hypothetical protein
VTGPVHLNADAQLNLAANLTLDSLNVGVLDGAVNPLTSERLIVGPGSYLKMVPTTGVNINTVLENRGIVDAVGPLNFVNDSVVNVAGATYASGGRPRLCEHALTVAGGLSMRGTVDLVNSNAASAAPATLQVTGGGLRNLAAGTVRSAAGRGGGRTLNAVLDNQGTVAVSTRSPSRALRRRTTARCPRAAAHHRAVERLRASPTAIRPSSVRAAR